MIENAYKELKKITRGKGGITNEDLNVNIRNLDIPKNAKKALLELTPHSYTGIAQKLAQNINK